MMNFDAFLAAPLLIQVHASAATASLVLGLVQILGPKGTLPHRAMGISFVILMMIVAGTAFFIRQINDGGFSFIHLFIPLTAFGLFGIVRNARAGKAAGHASSARSVFFAALLLPGLFAFMPGRLMHRIFLDWLPVTGSS
jgi:uncharacterized membrane protein